MIIGDTYGLEVELRLEKLILDDSLEWLAWQYALNYLKETMDFRIAEILYTNSVV